MKKFEQMKRLYTTLSGYIDPFDQSDVVISGTTADFDRLFELSWKTLKEYLYGSLGISEAKSGSPKTIIKIAYRENIMENEQLWLEMLRYRNDDTHHYNKSDAMLYISRIDSYYLAEIGRLIALLGDVIPAEEVASVDIPESLLAYCREKELNLADFVLGLEEKYGYEDVDSVLLSWEKIRCEIEVKDTDSSSVFRDGGEYARKFISK